MPYPDNMPSAYRKRREYSCTDSSCPQNSWWVTGRVDFGEFFVDYWEDTECPTCGKEGE